MEKDTYPMTKLNYVVVEGDHNETTIPARTNSDFNLF